MFSIAETKEAVLRWIARPQYVPTKMLVVAQQIGILKEDFKDFQKMLRTMHHQGLIEFGAGHVLLPLLDEDFDEHRMCGYFKRMPDGYGFVREVELNPNSVNISDEQEDVFIPPGKAQDAATGDFVSVILDDDKPWRKGRDGGKDGRSGKIEKILERKTRNFVGTYSENRDGSWVEVDGRMFMDPIRITDAAGRAVKPGDKVVIEILSYPAPWRTGEGVITEVLGQRGDLATETLAVMRQYHLNDQFDEQLLNEARWQAAQFEKWENAHQNLLPEPDENEEFCSEEKSDVEWTEDGRRVLTRLFTITIDPADARDFDDAISIELLPDGNWRLAVHIADVSHFVQPESRLDLEAFDRGNSVYLPDHVIPMLPEILCNGIASLQPNRLRFTKTTFLTFSPKGVCLDVEVCDSVICSNARLNYDQVDRFFAGDCSELPRKVRDALTQFRALAKTLRARRTARGKLDINLPEIRLEFDWGGKVTGVRRELNTESHQMIEEFMVSTNEAVAEEITRTGTNIMRRIHKAPSLEKFDSLGFFLEELGIHMAQKADRFELQRILEQTAGTPNEFAVHQAILRTMTRAEYSPEEEGHYALASACYCHFTSPIRRYADLTVHRQLESFIVGESPKRNFRKIYDQGKHLTYCETNAEDAERELTRVKMIHFFEEKGDVELDARIVGLTHHGFFVECERYPISGLVSKQSLPEDYYHFDSQSQTFNGRRLGNQFRLGDRVRVKITNLDSNKREISFELVKSSPKVDAAVLPVAGTIHSRVGGKKLRREFTAEEPVKPAKKRAVGAGGGKKSKKDAKKMTRKKK